MSIIKLQLAMTLDGYIARKDGSVDFLDNMEDFPTDDFNAFVDSIDTIVMGRGTYEVMLGFGEIPFENKKIIVLTSKELQTKQNHVSFSNRTVEEIVKEEKGSIWLFGGSKVIQSFINSGFIDEFHIVIVPIIIGSGIPLFLENNGMKGLKLDKAVKYGNLAMLVYKK